MRWFVSAAVALLLGWTWYMASPYLALWDLGAAIEQRSVARLSERVNGRALRVSLARQLASDEMLPAGRAGAISAADRQAAVTALAALADPIMEQLLTPGGILDLLWTTTREQAPAPEARPGRIRLASRSLAELVGASRWRGFRNIYFTLPPDQAPERRFRLQFRLSRLKWRLISVDLPERVRQRLAAQLLERVRAADPAR
jgi:hypothetical protein